MDIPLGVIFLLVFSNPLQISHEFSRIYSYNSLNKFPIGYKVIYEKPVPHRDDISSRFSYEENLSLFTTFRSNVLILYCL
jgi:hypothetical protein